MICLIYIYIYVSNISSLTFKNHQQPSDFSTSASHSWPTWQVQDSCVDVGLSEGWVLEDPQSSPWVSILSHESWSNLCRWLEEDFRKPPTMHKKEHSESCKCVCWWVKTYMITIFGGITWNKHPWASYVWVPSGYQGFDPQPYSSPSDSFCRQVIPLQILKRTRTGWQVSYPAPHGNAICILPDVCLMSL